MADYVPNTIVRVLKDVPLDDTYTDTRWFSNKGQQTSFFTGKAKYSFTDMTYQRVNNGIAQPRVALTCRVPMIADNLYDCNYMMFQNSNYGSRWFYAFIKQVNYINPNNTELVYEIDYLQTFMFDMEIKASFVEREHASAAEDVPFKNLVAEPVGVSTWCEDISNVTHVDAYTITGSSARKIVIGVMPSDAVSAIILGDGKMLDGIYSGCFFRAFSSADEANSVLKQLGTAGYQSSVIGVWMTTVDPQEGQHARTKVVTTPLQYKSETFNTLTGSYTIRNKKLLNSQFTYISGASVSGDTCVYKPELIPASSGSTFGGLCEYCSTSKLEMMFTPNYETGSGRPETFEYSLVDSQSVNCIWSSYGYINDAIKAGLKLALLGMAAVGGVTIAASVAGGAAGAAVAGESAGAAATSTGLVPYTTAVATQSAGTVGPSMTAFHEKLGMWSSVVNPQGGAGTGAGGYSGGSTTTFTPNTAGIEHLASLIPAKNPYMRGSNVGDTLAFSAGYGGFIFKRMCATSDELERLDTFFDMFGYQVNKVKVPNLDTREAWNYVKLAKPCIYGSVPVEGMAIIKSAFSRGIRLWHVDAVGDYSIQNPPK